MTTHICLNCGKVEKDNEDMGFEIIEELCKKCKR